MMGGVLSVIWPHHYQAGVGARVGMFFSTLISVNDEEQCTGRLNTWIEWGTVAFIVLGVVVCAIFAVFDHPHRAVLTLVATLLGTAVLRLILPGRPWFSSRNRWADVAVFAAIGLIIWYLSPYTATMGLG